MEKHQNELSVEKSRNILMYSRKLQLFKDSLTGEYRRKYNSIYSQSNSEFDRWQKKQQLSETDDCYVQGKYVLSDMQSVIKNANKEVDDVVWPIEMYESDFKSDDNDEAFQSIINQSLSKANSIDAVWSKKINALASKLTIKLRDCSVEKANNETLDSKWDLVNKEIGRLYVALFNKKNKKNIKSLVSGGTSEQIKFYNKYFNDLNSLYGYDYYIATTQDALRIELHKLGSKQEKIKHLDYWQENLKYWNGGLH